MQLVGIDEVGRGCWAGPLVAGAVILPIVWNDDSLLYSLRDSKKLTRKQREKLALVIQNEALAIGLGWVSASELDSIGLSKAVKQAMERALAALPPIVAIDQIIIDGNINYFPSDPRSVAIIKADDSVPAVSAASIMAKVARDQYMGQLSGNYAKYGFERHVGYGTALHRERLSLYGACDLHRYSFKPIQAIIAP